MQQETPELRAHVAAACSSRDAFCSLCQKLVDEAPPWGKAALPPHVESAVVVAVAAVVVVVVAVVAIVAPTAADAVDAVGAGGGRQGTRN
ncbi:unnamed protein product, partial [Prorocentrum cordatum]